MNGARKIFKFLLLTVCVTIAFYGCDFGSSGSIINQYQTDIYSIAFYTIPFATCSNFDIAETVGTDEYGRTLISYTSYATMFGLDDYSYKNGEINTYVICQKTDKKYIYYYDDYCYIFTKQRGEADDEELDLLKERNDWGKEYNESKMVKVPNSMHQSDDFMREDIMYPIGKTLGKKYEYSVNCTTDRFCTSKNGQLYIFREFDINEDDEINFGDSYLFYLDWEFNVIDYELIEEPIYACQDQIHQFKIKNKITPERYKP